MVFVRIMFYWLCLYMKQGEYMRLQERDYLEGLTEKEQEKYREILEEE